MSDPIVQRLPRHSHRAADTNDRQRADAHHLVNLAATQAERVRDLFRSQQKHFLDAEIRLVDQWRLHTNTLARQQNACYTRPRGY